MDLRFSCTRIHDTSKFWPPENPIYKLKFTKSYVLQHLWPLKRLKTTKNSHLPNMDLQSSCTQVFNCNHVQDDAKTVRAFDFCVKTRICIAHVAKYATPKLLVDADFQEWRQAIQGQSGREENNFCFWVLPGRWKHWFLLPKIWLIIGFLEMI